MKEIIGAQGATTPIISDVHFEAALTSSCYEKKEKICSSSVVKHTVAVLRDNLNGLL